MKRKPTLPGVDEKALASLARMFPPSGADRTTYADNGSSAPDSAVKPETASHISALASGPARAEQPPAPSSAAETTDTSVTPQPLVAEPVIPPPASESVSPPTVSAYASGPGETYDPGDPSEAPGRVGPQPAHSGGSASTTLALVMALIALIASGLLVGSNFFTEGRSAIDAQLAADAAAIKDLDFRLGTLRAQDDAIKAMMARLNAAQQHEVVVDNALKAVIDRITSVEEAAKDTVGKVAALDGTVGRTLSDLAARVGPTTTADRRPERFYLAATQLRSVVQGSAPYGKELNAVAGSADDNAELKAAIAVLASHADTGVPTVADLRATFAKTVSSRLPAYIPPNPSLTNRGVSWVKSLIPAGQGRVDSSEIRNGMAVAMAERSLADGQLSAAVDQLLLLEDRAALLAAEWLRDASTRLAVDKAATAVVNQAFERLSAAP